MIASVSRPDKTLAITSSWPARRRVMPNFWRSSLPTEAGTARSDFNEAPMMSYRSWFDIVALPLHLVGALAWRAAALVLEPAAGLVLQLIYALGRFGLGQI